MKGPTWTSRRLVLTGEKAGFSVNDTVVRAGAELEMWYADHTERLQKRFRFHTWEERSGEVRWMCSFDTTEADVDAFAAAIAEEMAAS
ncbi:ectoine synthase [Nocardia sp. NPDC057455]|uniref:ectoine synthase n=1 Tax=Nocardia sp. NPDC057455 TaxID=3346138 RepID=UPI0036709709